MAKLIGGNFESFACCSALCSAVRLTSHIFTVMPKNGL